MSRPPSMLTWADADVLAEAENWRWWRQQWQAGAIPGVASGDYIDFRLGEVEAEIERRRRFGLSRPAGLVAGRYPRAFLDELRQRADIVAVIDRHGVALHRSGQTWRGCCPFCRSDNPTSLAVWRSAGRFWCFACNVGGDIIVWHQLVGRLAFRQAVEGLAAVLGVPVPAAPRITARRRG